VNSGNSNVDRQLSGMKNVRRNLIAGTDVTYYTILEFNSEPLHGLACNRGFAFVADSIEAGLARRRSDSCTTHVNKGPGEDRAFKQPAMRMANVPRRLQPPDSRVPHVKTYPLTGVSGQWQLDETVWMPVGSDRICAQVRKGGKLQFTAICATT
jgi:hypothetical protein